MIGKDWSLRAFLSQQPTEEYDGCKGAHHLPGNEQRERIDGYRDHSSGAAYRGNFNLGYRLSPNVETRFYVYAASTEQHIPGEVTKAQALNAPRSANPFWSLQDKQRNVHSIGVATKPTFRFGDSATLDRRL